MSDEQQEKGSFLTAGLNQAVPPPPPAHLKHGKSRTSTNGNENGEKDGTTPTRKEQPAANPPPVSSPVQLISPVETSPAPVRAMKSRTQYPEGESFDSRNEVFNSFVLRGMKEMIEDLKGRTGQSISNLTSIAYIALLEEYGYDMTPYREKLQPYYALREMEAKIKKFEETQAKNKARRKKKQE